MLFCCCVPLLWLSHAEAEGSEELCGTWVWGGNCHPNSWDYCSIPSKPWGTSAGALTNPTVPQGYGLVIPFPSTTLWVFHVSALTESQLLLQPRRLKPIWLQSTSGAPDEQEKGPGEL